MILPPPCLTVDTVLLGLKSLTLMPPKIPLGFVAKYFNLCLEIFFEKLLSRRHLICPYGQLQISVKLEAVDSFLVSNLSVCGDVKLDSDASRMLVGALNFHLPALISDPPPLHPQTAMCLRPCLQFWVKLFSSHLQMGVGKSCCPLQRTRNKSFVLKVLKL